jgi:hypothetical protein
MIIFWLKLCLVGVVSNHDYRWWPDRVHRGWKPLPQDLNPALGSQKVSSSIKLVAGGQLLG